MGKENKEKIKIIKKKIVCMIRCYGKSYAWSTEDDFNEFYDLVLLSNRIKKSIYNYNTLELLGFKSGGAIDKFLTENYLLGSLSLSPVISTTLGENEKRYFEYSAEDIEKRVIFESDSIEEALLYFKLLYPNSRILLRSTQRKLKGLNI